MDGLRVRGLVKRFGKVVALDGLDLDLAPGEIVAVLGPNGAGKSTLLRILGTIVLPDAGEVEVAGYDVTKDPLAVRQRIGLMIGDERSFYWRLSGYENLRFFGVLFGLNAAEAGARARELLSDFGLARAADRRVLGYSSGMRARLLLARALLRSPGLLLLDEPTRTLDPQAAVEVRRAAQELAAERGAGVMIASHDLHEAVAVATRIVILAAGRVQLEVTADEVDASRLESLFLEAVQGEPETAGGAGPVGGAL